MQKFADLMDQVFEHEGTFWRINYVGNPGGYTWAIRLRFEPAEYKHEREADAEQS